MKSHYSTIPIAEKGAGRTAPRAPVGRLRRAFITLSIMLGLTLAQQAVAESIPVDAQVRIANKTTSYSLAKSKFSVTMDLNNYSKETIWGPLWIVVTGTCRPDVTLTNVSGLTAAGLPYLAVPLTSNVIKPGGWKRGVTLQFSNPGRLNCSNRYSVYGYRAPVAVPGAAQTVDVGTLVKLDGSGSRDPHGLPLTYQWSLTVKPANSQATLTNPTSAIASFTPDVHGLYTAQLIVKNGISTSLPATVNITARATGLVQLHANASDPLGNVLHYKWRVSEGSIVDVDAPDTSYLMPPGPGVHFVNVLIYNNKGGYTERRIAVFSDGLGTISPSPTSGYNPVASTGTSHSDDAYITAWSSAGRYVNLPDASVARTDGKFGNIKSDLYGLFEQSSPDFISSPNLFIDIWSLTFVDSTVPSGLTALSYAGKISDPAYYTFRSGYPSIYGRTGSYIFGSVKLNDGSLCGLNNPFFQVESTATATPLDNAGNALALPVRVNAFGDYALLYDSRVAKVRLQCEATAPVTVTVTLDPTTGFGVAKPATFTDGAQPVVPDVNPIGITATLEGQPTGKFLSPNLTGQVSNLIPGGDHFLSYKGIDSKKSACQYYKAIGATTDCDANDNLVGAITFDDWKRKTRLDPYIDTTAGVQEFTATYINKVDLNLTRRHHSIAYPNGSVAAYVCNHLGPASPAQADVDAAINNAVNGLNLVACVAMDYGVAGNYVRFMGFAANGQLITSINLDGRREKFVPGTCTVCHGGDQIRGKFAQDGTGSPDIGAHFLPYDIGNFAFSAAAGLTRADQEEAIYNLNQNVLKVIPTPQEIDVIGGWYPPGSHVQNTDYVPQAWLNEAALAGDPVNAQFPWQRLGKDLPKLYKDVNAHYCRTCHVSIVADGTQDTESIDIWLDGEGTFDSDIDPVICGGYPDVHRNRSMPNSLVTFNLLWNDAAAKATLERLKGGPCLDAGNPALAEPPVAVPVIETLKPGTPVVIKGGGGSLRYFALDVPAGTTSVTFATSGGTGDVSIEGFPGKPDLLPSPYYVQDHYSLCYGGTVGTKQTCVMDLAWFGYGPGPYYLVLSGDTAYDGVSLSVTFSP